MALGESDQHQIARLALDEGADRGEALAHDEVALPVPGHGAVGGLGGALERPLTYSRRHRTGNERNHPPGCDGLAARRASVSGRRGDGSRRQPSGGWPGVGARLPTPAPRRPRPVSGGAPSPARLGVSRVLLAASRVRVPARSRARSPLSHRLNVGAEGLEPPACWL